MEKQAIILVLRHGEDNKSFHRFHQSSGKDLQGKERKKTKTLITPSGSEELGSLEVKPLGLPCPHGVRRQSEPARASGSDCSHPSGMPADGVSRRPWRQLEDFAAGSGFLALSPAAARGLARAAGPTRTIRAAGACSLTPCPWHHCRLQNRTNHRKHGPCCDREVLLCSTCRRHWNTEEGCRFGT